MTAERVLWAVGAGFVIALVGLGWSLVHAYTVRRGRLKIMLGEQRRRRR